MDSYNDGFEWGITDDELELEFILAHENEQIASSSASSISTPNRVDNFVAMGFPEDMVIKAIQENGGDNSDAILNALLTYSALEISPGQDTGLSPKSLSLSDDDCLDELSDVDSASEQKIPVAFADQDPGPSRRPTFLHDGYGPSDGESTSGVEKGHIDISAGRDWTVSLLFDMGYIIEDALHAVEKCGVDASIEELADFICANELAKSTDSDTDGILIRSQTKKKRKYSEVSRRSKQQPVYLKKLKRSLDLQLERPRWNAELASLPNRMVGFGVPGCSYRLTSRRIPNVVLGPPYFYYENVASTPVGVWEQISQFLYDIKPEFVDSIHFSAAARKRGYIHNLPIDSRQRLLPIPPQTIFEALPQTKEWWPSWDTRTKLNCLLTSIGIRAELIDMIRSRVRRYNCVPPLSVREDVIKECKRWNLVWIGKYKVVVLEPEEMEILLGFPKYHTRGLGRVERYKALGNTFQIDTVAYHLSVLRPMFPQGLNVLSLFSGIGGAEVALHRLGIRLKNVVSVEISPLRQKVLQEWWEATHRRGNLIHIDDVRNVNLTLVNKWIRKFGGFDLVIGGSPCNNLAGLNRKTRDGLEGEHSSLFYHYYRILELVRSLMKNR